MQVSGQKNTSTSTSIYSTYLTYFPISRILRQVLTHFQSRRLSSLQIVFSTMSLEEGNFSPESNQCEAREPSDPLLLWVGSGHKATFCIVAVAEKCLLKKSVAV